MSNHLQLKKLLIEYEGQLCHMYLDSAGEVTVGIGHMIPDLAAAQVLRFLVRGTTIAADEEQIRTDFHRVKTQRPGMLAATYKAFTKLDMRAEICDALLDQDLAKTETGVRARFRNYDLYPPAAQDALLDMAFNLGLPGLVGKFPRLKDAAEAGNWSTCAAECHRSGISDARNDGTRRLFILAAGGLHLT